MTRSAVLTLVISAVLSAAPAFSASPSIGVATAIGSYSINDSPVTGETNILDGTELRTTVSPSDVHLANGADVRLATRSATNLYSDHIVLKDGALRMAKFDSYPVHVGELDIEADTPGTEAIIRTRGKAVEVASLGGTVKVTDGGAMLTRVAAGTKMSFQNANPAAQSGASPAQAAPAQTGAAPAPERGPISDKKIFLWTAGICAVGAIVVGSIAAAQGKSPF